LARSRLNTAQQVREAQHGFPALLFDQVARLAGYAFGHHPSRKTAGKIAMIGAGPAGIALSFYFRAKIHHYFIKRKRSD
jgi:hypothetical protein